MKNNQRGGYTLLELVAVLAGLFLIGVSATRILYQVDELGRQSLATKQVIQSVEKLAIDFRTDLKDASNVDEVQSDFIALSNDKRTTEYRVEDNPARIERVVTTDEKIVAAETYYLTENCRPFFARRDGVNQRRVVRIDLTGHDEGTAVGHQLIIDGVVP